LRIKNSTFDMVKTIIFRSSRHAVFHTNIVSNSIYFTINSKTQNTIMGWAQN
jgi:hypothetical protein